MGKSEYKPKRRRGRPPKNKIEYTAKKLGVPVWLVVVVLVVIIAVYGALSYYYWWYPFDGTLLSGYAGSVHAPGTDDGDDDGDTPPPIVTGDLSIHFLQLGNKYNGDSTYIKAGDIDILVDAGSRQDSADDIKAYVDSYCTDGVLEYVIVTHADRDHIAGFVSTSSVNSIFTSFQCQTIIDFPLTNKVLNEDDLYTKYINERNAEVDTGAVRYSALECYNNVGNATRVITLTDEISIEILYNYYYDHTSSDENNYSVCFMLKQGERNFLFTGDLEKKGEEYLVENYPNLPQVELFKGGHHGSPTSSNEILLEKIRPKVVCVCCCAGSTEFTQNPSNTFPSQEFINRVSKYTTKVYVTVMAILEFETSATGQYKYNATTEKYEYVGSDNGGTHKCSVANYVAMNGNIRVVSTATGVTVSGTNNNTVLKDTEWFSTNRTTPSYWQ